MFVQHPDLVLCPKCNSSRLLDDKDGYRYIGYTCQACYSVFDETDGVHVQYWLWRLVAGIELGATAFAKAFDGSRGLERISDAPR